MARPTPKKVTATTAEQKLEVGMNNSPLRAFMIYNDGSNDIQVNFDSTIDATNHWLVKSKAVLTVDWSFFRFHYKTTTGTSDIYVLYIAQ